MPGEEVSFNIEIPLGTVAEIYYSVYPDLSTKHKIDGNSFIMPYGDVRLSATFTELEYTVRFESDGRVISEKNDYKYGDTVRIPNNPTKVSDGKYNYSFKGWSPEISEVTGDVTYVAQFDAVLIPVAPKEPVSTLVLLVYVGLSVFALGAIVLTVFVLDRKKVISVGGMVQKIKTGLSRGAKALDTNTEDAVENGDENKPQQLS